jgi:dTDP-4-amino-4,6-dideoxygalactose transaminase
LTVIAISSNLELQPKGTYVYPRSMTVSPLNPIYTSNPRASYLAHKAEIDAAIQGVLASPHYILGPAVEHFEAAFARFIGVAHGIGVNSGTDALHLALAGLGIGQNDEVITVSHTSVATVAAIEMSGAKPVLVDVELPWFTVDPEAAASAIGPRTRAIIAVHLYGQPADLTALKSLCARHGLALIEDCAQSHGAIWEGRPAGSFGAAACFSFYPTKNLGAVGDGGMVLTNDGVLAEKIRQLRQYGWQQPQMSVTPGWNSRLGPLQAAILDVKLKHLPEYIALRRQIAEVYRKSLSGIPLDLPFDREGSQHAYHLFVVRCTDGLARRDLLKHLAAKGIIAGIHYPAPVHMQPAYAGRLETYNMTYTEMISAQILSLPLYPELPEKQQNAIVSAVRSFFDPGQ